jgi:hypothetical protein
MNVFLENIQEHAIVVSANQIAENDNVYTVVANATFTDPSPVEGKGYKVFVRDGTATINGVGYTDGTTVFRVFHSGAWVSYVSLPDSNFVASNAPITGATKTKITYDSKGLVTAGLDATTADIADSTDKRYVTDANLTVIGNTSGTNTGDETQSSILTKLGAGDWVDYSGDSTVVGWSSTTTLEIFYRQVFGDTYECYYRISGTSNDTVATFTLPFNFLITFGFVGTTVNNGAANVGRNSATAGGGTVSLLGSATGSYASAGSKAALGQFMFRITI